MNFKQIDNSILNHRGDASFLDGVIEDMQKYKDKLDWQVNKFLNDHCKGISGIELTDLDTSSPIYRYYNYKCGQYADVARTIRVAKAFK